MKRVIICVMLFLTYFSACGQNPGTGMPRKAEEKDIKEMASARTSQVNQIQKNLRVLCRAVLAVEDPV